MPNDGALLALFQNGGEGIRRLGIDDGITDLLKGESTTTLFQPARPASMGTGDALSGRLSFIIDATRSRKWQEGQIIHRRMFLESTQPGKALSARVTYFKGEAPCVSSDWTSQAEDITRFMANVQCESGDTQIISAIKCNLSSNPPPTAIVLIGDYCDQKNDSDYLIEAYGTTLGHRKIPVFAFLEGNEFAGRKAFMTLVELSGGAFATFGSSLDLSSLVRVAAAYCTDRYMGITDLLRQEGSNVGLPGRKLAQRLLTATNG